MIHPNIHAYPTYQGATIPSNANATRSNDENPKTEVLIESLQIGSVSTQDEAPGNEDFNL